MECMALDYEHICAEYMGICAWNVRNMCGVFVHISIWSFLTKPRGQCMSL